MSGHPSSNTPAENLKAPPRGPGGGRPRRRPDLGPESNPVVDEVAPDVSDNPTSPADEGDKGMQISYAALCQAQASLIVNKNQRIDALEQQLVMTQAMVADRDAEILRLKNPESVDEPATGGA